MQIGSPRSVISHVWANSYTKRVIFYVTALVSAVVIVGAAASYLVMRNQISNMAENRTLQELHRTGTSFSTIFTSSIIPAAEQLFETAEVNNLIYGSHISMAQLLTATQFVDRFKLANPLIDSIVVYNSQRNVIYSTEYGLTDADDRRNSALMRIFRQINDFRLYRFIPRRDGEKKLLTVIFGTRPYVGTRLLGGLVVNVSESAVRSQLLGRFREDGSRLTILDSSGTLLSDNDPTAFGTDAENDPVLRRVVSIAGESGTFTIRDGNSSRLVSFVREPLAGWTFVSSTPSRLLFSGIARWRNEIILIFSLLLLLSIFLAVTAGRRVSAPLGRLLLQARVLQSGLSELGSTDAHRDDVALVSETMDLLQKRLRDLSRSRGTGEISLSRIFGRALLDQAVSAEEHERLSARLFDSASGEVWILTHVADRAELVGLDSRSHLPDICRDLARRLSGLPEVLCAVHVEKCTVAAALAAGGDEVFGLPVGVKELLDSVGASGDMTFTTGVSDPVDDFDELSSAYDAAAEAVHLRFRHGRGKVIVQEDRLKATDAYALPEGELRRLSEQARLLNAGAVDAVIRELLDGVLPYRYEDFVFLAQHILHILERVFVDSGTMSGRDLAEYRSHVLNVKWIETGEDVRDLALRWYRLFADTVHDGDTERLSALVADVKKVVDQSLFDPDLSTKSVAGRLKLSVNYVRTSFRSATGDSISNHITRLRIERCKELLKSSSLPVKEIAQSVGFQNYNYFFTLFKKQTGRTPQEYQRQFIIM